MEKANLIDEIESILRNPQDAEWMEAEPGVKFRSLRRVAERIAESLPTVERVSREVSVGQLMQTYQSGFDAEWDKADWVNEDDDMERQDASAIAGWKAVQNLVSQLPTPDSQAVEALQLQRDAFLAGAKWWEFHSTKGTMWQSDQADVWAASLIRYPGPPSSPSDPAKQTLARLGVGRE